MGSGASTVDDDDLFDIGLSVAVEKEKISRGEKRYANGDVYKGRWRFEQKHGKGVSGWFWSTHTIDISPIHTHF